MDSDQNPILGQIRLYHHKADYSVTYKRQKFWELADEIAPIWSCCLYEKKSRVNLSVYLLWEIISYNLTRRTIVGVIQPREAWHSAFLWNKTCNLHRETSTG